MSDVHLRTSEHSLRCSSEQYWNTRIKKCEPCEKNFPIKAGYEFASNCGLSDDGGRHEGLYIKCRQGTFNDGTFVQCKPCSTCQASKLALNCTSTSDSHCCGEGEHVEKGECKDSSQTTTLRSTAVTTEQPTTTIMTTTETTAFKTLFQSTNPSKTMQTHPTTTQKAQQGSSDKTNKDSWIGPVEATFITLLCVALICVIFIFKRRNCKELKRRLSDKRNHIHLEGSNECLKTESTKDLQDINNLLSKEIQAAPLQAVLNDLDVVDELVLLLDPDTPGAKNTRHLAANCSIPFTWINYAYSRKESKSPLVAMLEKVISKHPNWNIGHLAGLLSNIERNDAVAVLAKITISEEEV